MKQIALELRELLNAKYGGENFANLEYFSEWEELVDFVLSRCSNPWEYNECVDVLDNTHTFCEHIQEQDWQPTEHKSWIRNYQGTRYKGQDRKRIQQEFWATKTKGENNLCDTPLLELWARMRDFSKTDSPV